MASTPFSSNTLFLSTKPCYPLALPSRSSPPFLSRRRALIMTPHCSSSSAASDTPPLPFNLRGYWSDMVSLINAELESAVPVRYPDRIYEAMRYSVLSPGAKRASPVLCIAAASDLLGLPAAAALPTACALEMVHAASLIHDDLPCMDASPLRRGRPSNHTVFGTGTAVLAGDALFPLCFSHIVSRTPPDLVPHAALINVISEIARAVGSTGMAAGQFLDFQNSADVMAVIEKKFGEMAECSAACGGYLAGAEEEVVGSLRRYGRAVGVLYQVVDDIVMEEGNGGGAGKMRSNASVELAEELRLRAKEEVKILGDRFGEEKAAPLGSFVDYALERGFVVAGEAAPA